MSVISRAKALIWRVTDAFAPEPGETSSLRAPMAIIPIAIAVAVAIDFGMSSYIRRKMDAAAETALAAAIAQSHSLHASGWDVSLLDLEAKGRARADIVFNAQKPNVRKFSSTFEMTREGAANAFKARIAYAAEVNTIFLRFIGIRELDVAGAAETIWTLRDALIDDRFEELEAEVLAAGTKLFTSPSGWRSGARAASSGAPAIQLAAANRYPGPPPPEGVAVAVELDAGAGNMFISKKLTAEPGPHVLRYWYRDRAETPSTAPAWLCATREEDVDWMTARDRSESHDTNRMSVYLTPDIDHAPPREIAFSAASRVDSCYSSGHRWIERVVRIDIVARGDYWLSFRGEGRSDGTGAAIANISLCRDPCRDEDVASRPAAENYPWSPGELLFEDRFMTEGASPLARSGEAPGWASVPGWTAWPDGSVRYRKGENGASGFVELDGPAGEGERPENRALGRPFLLVPGFYNLRYTYSVGPSSLNRAVACNYFGLEAALQRATRVKGADTHRINVVIDPDGPYLHPEPGGPDGGARAIWRSATGRSENDLSGPTPPRLPDLSNAVDFCVGAPPNIGTVREIGFKIEKAGYYWISFVAAGPADGQGGRIGAVQLFARGATYPGSSVPRIIRYTDRGDTLTPRVGSWLTRPLSGSRALYRIQVQ